MAPERSAAQMCAEIDAATDRLAGLDPAGQAYVDLEAWRDDMASDLFATHSDLPVIPWTARLTPNEQDIMRADLAEIRQALGLGHSDQPYRQHDVIQLEVLPEIRRLKSNVVGCSGIGPWCIAGEPRQDVQRWPDAAAHNAAP